MVYTFWEGKMPAYIRLCLDTWKLPFVILDYNNVNQYTATPITKQLESIRFSMPQIADYVRVHVLRDNGGIWLDADTIMITDKLPEAHILGNPYNGDNTIGFLQAEKDSEFFKQWAHYQESIIERSNDRSWDILGNRFTDNWIKGGKPIIVQNITQSWPETYMIKEPVPRRQKYHKFYFESDYHLDDILPTDILMLHNSWTPQSYKELTIEQVLSKNCTLSNILRESR